MVSCTVANVIEHFYRNSVWILLRLYHAGRNSADDHGFDDPALTVTCNVADHFTAAGRVTDVNSVLEIERFDESGNVRGIGVHVVAVYRLSGTSMPASIMSDHSV